MALKSYIDMETVFTLSFRGNLVKLEKHVMQSLPKKSQFTEIVQKQHNLGLDEILQENRNDLQIYVNRSISLFNHILDYIEHGELHYPQYVCPIIISKELEFWGYCENDLGSCCFDRILKEKEDDKKLKVISEQWQNCNNISQTTTCGCATKKKDRNRDDHERARSHSFLEEEQPIETSNGKDFTNEEDLHMVGSCRNSCYLQKLSNLLVKPLDSLPGKIWVIAIVSAIAVSMVTLMLECEPRIRHPSLEEVSKTTNITHGEGLLNYYFHNSLIGFWIVYLDFACVVILSVDFVARFVISQRRCMFLIDPFNIADILGIIPVWIVFVIVIVASVQKWSLENWKTLEGYSMILGILHILRIFRFRLILLHFKPLRLISLAYKRSLKDLLLLSTVLTMASLVFGFLIYFLEVFFDPVDSFSSGLDAQWWALITMATVGYGDFVPKTDAGRIVGILCALFGIVIVAMITAIIISNFMQLYKNVETIERKKKYLASMRPQKIIKTRL